MQIMIQLIMFFISLWIITTYCTDIMHDSYLIVLLPHAHLVLLDDVLSAIHVQIFSTCIVLILVIYDLCKLCPFCSSGFTSQEISFKSKMRQDILALKLLSKIIFASKS